jgi:hypothetical protein
VHYLKTREALDWVCGGNRNLDSVRAKYPKTKPASGANTHKVIMQSSKTLENCSHQKNKIFKKNSPIAQVNAA